MSSFLVRALTACCILGGEVDVSVETSGASAAAEFAAAEIRSALEGREISGEVSIVLGLEDDPRASGLGPEGFRIRVERSATRQSIRIAGADAAGSMYGGLEVAETILTGGPESVRALSQNPYMAMRGTKFNCPLDVRTPSYTDVCDAAQMNIPQMWSLEFWKEYIDTLARYRFNFVSLWSLHPFPSLVEVADYPEVALDDVQRSRTRWKEHYPLQGRDFVTREILENVETVRQLKIAEKIAFWREVMAYGKLRNVDFYVVTWNIFTYGTFGRYGITDEIGNETTVDYFRQSVRDLLLTYPDLAGVGLTTGENMPGASFEQKEAWAFATYGEGVLEAARAQPGRKITFIHRQHQARAQDIARTFRPLIEHPDVEFIFSFKYAKAHVYSSTTQPYHLDFVRDLGTLKTIWTLRNDDVYYFRWGAPDFVREFIKNIPHAPSRGYYYGSDQYVWGREFLQRDTGGRRQLEIVKHWYQWMLWGRLGYDPEVTNERLRALVAVRLALDPTEAGTLFAAWHHASMVYPTTTGFHWGSLDFQWYIEGCQSRPGPAGNETGFHDVNRFISLAPHPTSGYRSIPEYVQDTLAGENTGGRTPPDVAASLDAHAGRAFELVSAIEPRGRQELERTVADIRIVATLGQYYADKIRGATQLALHRRTGESARRQAAIERLVDAARHWIDYTRRALARHKNPLWTNRVGHVDWKRTYRHVLEDIRIAGGKPEEHDLPAVLEFTNEEIVRY